MNLDREPKTLLSDVHKNTPLPRLSQYPIEEYIKDIQFDKHKPNKEVRVKFSHILCVQHWNFSSLASSPSYPNVPHTIFFTWLTPFLKLILAHEGLRKGTEIWFHLHIF